MLRLLMICTVLAGSAATATADTPKGQFDYPTSLTLSLVSNGFPITGTIWMEDGCGNKTYSAKPFKCELWKDGDNAAKQTISGTTETFGGFYPMTSFSARHNPQGTWRIKLYTKDDNGAWFLVKNLGT